MPLKSCSSPGICRSISFSSKREQKVYDHEPRELEGETPVNERLAHLLAHYLHALATDLHSYYNAHQFLVKDENLRNARLNLILATQTVLRKGLSLLGVSAPEEM